jgi:hypothetical protein
VTGGSSVQRRRFLTCLSALCLHAELAKAFQEVSAERGCSWVRGLGAMSDTTARSGNRQLDNALIAEVKKVDQTFQINPGYRFLRDGNQPNAYASPETQVSGTKGTVLFGLTLLGNELQTEYGGAAIAGIAAHEGAHIVQFNSPSLRSRLSASTVKRIELHADFLAGYYFARTKRTERSLLVFGRSLFSKGDYQFNDRDHHGTPQERVAAMRAGYASADDDLNIATERGVAYVQRA